MHILTQQFEHVPWKSTFIGHVDGVDFWWFYDHTRGPSPSLIAIEGERPDQHIHHQLPWDFHKPGQGVDLAKCVALHEERKNWFKKS